jgi:hypothetical protein
MALNMSAMSIYVLVAGTEHQIQRDEQESSTRLELKIHALQTSVTAVRYYINVVKFL